MRIYLLRYNFLGKVSEVSKLYDVQELTPLNFKGKFICDNNDALHNKNRVIYMNTTLWHTHFKEKQCYSRAR